MPLLTRADFEEQMEILDAADQLISVLVAEGEMSGFEAVRKSTALENKRRKLRGQLGFAASVTDHRLGTACLNRKQHMQGCRCRKLAQAQALNEA